MSYCKMGLGGWVGGWVGEDVPAADALDDSHNHDGREVAAEAKAHGTATEEDEAVWIEWVGGCMETSKRTNRVDGYEPVHRRMEVGGWVDG